MSCVGERDGRLESLIVVVVVQVLGFPPFFMRKCIRIRNMLSGKVVSSRPLVQAQVLILFDALSANQERLSVLRVLGLLAKVQSVIFRH